MLQQAKVEEFETPDLSHKEFLKIDRDYEKAARVIDLMYVDVRSDGILRVKKGKGFFYSYHGKTLRDKDLLERIRNW